MRLIYVLRHGHSQHLVQGFRHRITSCEYVHSLQRWNLAELTQLGHEQAARAAEGLHGVCRRILSSPLERAQQTARHVAGDELEVTTLPLLSEVDELPWRLPHWIRLREHTWFYAIFLCMLLDGRLPRLLREARAIVGQALEQPEPTLLVSHKARIMTLLAYARMHPRLRVLKCDLSPTGLSLLAWV